MELTMDWAHTGLPEGRACRILGGYNDSPRGREEGGVDPGEGGGSLKGGATVGVGAGTLVAGTLVTGPALRRRDWWSLPHQALQTAPPLQFIEQMWLQARYVKCLKRIIS